MQVGDLVREISKMDRKCSLGVVLEVGSHNPFAHRGSHDYLVHFFDDNDKCWMSANFVETVNASR